MSISLTQPPGTPNKGKEVPSRAEVSLLKKWQRWTAMVEVYAAHRHRSGTIPADEYRQLHANLLKACQGLAQTASPEQASYYADLADLLRPWQTPGTLEGGDWGILLDLLQRCRQIESELGSRRPVGRLTRLLRGVVKTLIILAIGGILCGIVYFISRPLTDWLAWSWQTLWLAIKQATAMQRLFVGGVIVSLLLIPLVVRTRQN